MVSEKKSKTSVGLIIALVITAIQAWRISAISYLMQVGDSVPVFWATPFKGDTFIGVTAVPVAFLLWKYRSLHVWTLGVTWQVIGLVDLYFAMETQLIHPLGTAPYFVIPAGILMHALALALIFKNHPRFFSSSQR